MYCSFEKEAMSPSLLSTLYEAKDSHKLLVIRPQPQKPEIAGVYHHTHLNYLLLPPSPLSSSYYYP